MNKREAEIAVHTEVVDDAAPLPLAELIAYAHIERTSLTEMVEAGVLTPTGASFEQWTFVHGDLRRLRVARRLMTDLDVNLHGAALILDLLEERESLLKRIRKESILAPDF